MEPQSLAEAGSHLATALQYGGVPTAFVISARKAIGRLLGAAAEVPATWLDGQAALLKAKGKSSAQVEEAVAKRAVVYIEKDDDIGQRAASRLAAKEYRRQNNAESVAAAAVENLTASESIDNSSSDDIGNSIEIDDDWLNVFERYAEDASTERMQKLWGRVLAGEIRQPGRFALRTLRFLSEFSQSEALVFSSFCQNIFGEFAPTSLAKPTPATDERHLFYMESAGLITGASGMGISINIKSDSSEWFVREGNLYIRFIFDKTSDISIPVINLTPLGQDLVALLPNRDAEAAAKKVAHAIRVPQMKAAYLGTASKSGVFMPMEVLWQDDPASMATPRT